MDMWSIIYKLDAEEHDCVPSSWIISKERSWYPDKSKNTAMRLAKEKAKVLIESDWIQIRIAIVKRNLDNFDRSMKDALRLNQGRKTMTESENEERGRGLRVKRSLYRSDSECSSGGTPAKRTSPRKSSKVGPPPAAKKISFPLSSPQSFQSPKQKESSKAEQTQIASQACKLNACKLKRKHFCVFKQGQVSMETIAHGICSLSRGLTILRTAMENIHQDIISRMQPETETSNRSSDQQEREAAPTSIEFEDDNEEGSFDDTLKIFPITNISDFKAFDEKLQGGEYRKQVANALMSVATKTSFSRAVTSVLRYVLNEDITASFTWKGQKRWGEQKESFSTSKFSKMLIETIKKRWASVDKMKIEKSIASWLAQTQVKLKNKKGSGSPRAGTSKGSSRQGQEMNTYYEDVDE